MRGIFDQGLYLLQNEELNRLGQKNSYIRTANCGSGSYFPGRASFAIHLKYQPGIKRNASYTMRTQDSDGAISIIV
jgi:hypothetical protein